MDNCLSGWRRPARQTTEKAILYECILHRQAGRSDCVLARWRVVLPCFLDNVTSYHLFRLACDCAHVLLCNSHKFICGEYSSRKELHFICYWIVCILWINMASPGKRLSILQYFD